MADSEAESPQSRRVARIFAVVALAAMLAWSGAITEPGAESEKLAVTGGPAETVRAYYKAIADNNCGRAAQLRPNYTADRCRAISHLDVAQVRLDGGDERSAWVFVQVSYTRGGRTKTDTGHFTVVREEEGWLIDSFAPAETTPPTVVEPVPPPPPPAVSTKPVAPPPFALAPPKLFTPGSPPASPPQLPSASAFTPIPSVAGPWSPSPDTMLGRLWTADQLRARDGDTTIRRQRPPDHAPPQAAAVTLIAAQPLPDAWRNSIRRVRLPEGVRLVALTFDLCERADDVTGYDGAIVDILRAEQVPATFFAGGKWLRSHSERATQLMAEPLFEIGNHGWTHGNLRVLPLDRARDQIVWTQAQYASLREWLARRAAAAGVEETEMARVPSQPRVFRFPYGTCRPETLKLVGDLGLVGIQWDVVSTDAVKGQSPDLLRRVVVAGVKPGSIVVMHGNGRGSGTAAALPAIIKDLRGRGYRFVTVSDLLRAGEPEPALDCYEVTPGDNKRYDVKFGEGTG